uniref:Uncharacterized protein n=1 Tax=Avena sativa TaxID=4498 RepID=A0ACD5XFD8_AVESA
MQIIAATLSSGPEQGGHVFAAAITDTLRQLAFWRLGDSVATSEIRGNNAAPWHVLEDLLYHDGTFQFLTSEGHILICTPSVQQDARGQQRLVIDLQERHFDLGQHGQMFVLDGHGRAGLLITARYLIQSRGETLMVVRYARPVEMNACEFSVHRQVEHGDGLGRHWEELPALDGRIMFMARGSSRCYDVENFPALSQGVYYLDDRDSGNRFVLQDDDDGYRCQDNGRYSWSGWPVRQHEAEAWFPAREPSDYSSPIWVLP